MFHYLTEMMLTEYFAVQALFGRFVSDRKNLFDALGRIFLLPQDEAEKLYQLSETDQIKSIKTEKEYHQYRRMKQYFALTNVKNQENLFVDEMIRLKGAAISTVVFSELVHDFDETQTTVCRVFTLAADSGMVLALHVLGILQSEGILFEKDPEAGMKHLKKAADWNSEEGLLAAMYYDKARRGEYLARLKLRFERTSHADSLRFVTEYYGAQPARVKKEYLLLEKAFAQGIVKRETYAKPYARVIFSKALKINDKEGLIFSVNKELFAEVSRLPLKLSTGKTEDFDATALNAVVPQRQSVTEAIVCAMENIDLRTLPAYRPMCLSSNSRYLVEQYAAGIAEGFPEAHIEYIDVADLTESDFEPSKNHVFVRGCDEDRLNIYVIFFYGEIHERVIELVKNFLQSLKRGKFRLNHPSASLDLSAVLPICFCEEEYENSLRSHCDVIEIPELSNAERGQIVEHILQEKTELYGLDEVALSAQGQGLLVGRPVEEIERVLDHAIQINRKKGSKLALTEEIIRFLLGNLATPNKIGFGGDGHEN